jgi:glycosyltransferase involved in cell wall biosynthesis
VRVLRVIYALHAGGTEMMLARSLGELRGRGGDGIDVEVCTFVSGGEVEDVLHATGIRIFSLGAHRRRGLLRAPLELARLIRKRGYDVVHAHLFPAEVLVALVSLLVRGPVYVLGKHNAWTRRNRPWHVALERFTTSRYARIVCNSTDVERAVIARVPATAGRTVVVPNGVRGAEGVARSAAPAYDVIAVGNLRDGQKGIDVLLRALTRIRGELGRVIVVGDDPARPGLQRLCRDLGLEHRVEFHGASRRVAELLADSRLFVLSSRYEGMPNVLLEAMALGLPAVATAVGGVADVMTDGATGVIVPPEDPEALAHAIGDLLADPERAARLGRAAHAHIRTRFGVAAHLDRLLAVYDELLQRNERRMPEPARP